MHPRALKRGSVVGVLASLAVSVAAPTAAGIEVPVGPGGFGIAVVRSGPDETVLEIRVGSFEAEPVRIGGETFYEITLPGEPYVAPEGDPALPRICRSLIIPDGARMEAEIVEEESAEIHLPVAPSCGAGVRGASDGPSRRRPWSSSDAPGFRPASAVSLGRPYIFRDFRGISLSVCPFSYDPETRTVRVSTHLTVRVYRAGPGRENVRAPGGGGPSRAFREIYRRHFLNYAGDRYTPVGEEGRMIVIAHADYLAAIQPYVDWKNQRGIPTDLYDVAAIGSSPQEIRDFIAAQYSAGDGLAFVQLVGDADRIPTFLTDVIFWDIHGCSDSSYGLLEGTDTYPEVIVGRFSAETVEQVETQVERTIWYERDIAGGHWLHRAAGLGTVWGEGYGYNGWSGVQSLAVIRSDLLAYGYTEVAELYEEGVPPFSIVPVEAWEVTEVLEDGIGLLDVDGNADTTYLDTGSYTIGDIHALENGYALPFIFLAAPWCGNFVKQCFAEEWLRATSNTSGAPTGAVAVYCWSNALEYAPPQAAMHEMVDLLTSEAAHTFGGLVVNGACFMMDLYGAPDYYDTFRNSNILGDASLTVRTAYPDPMAVTHDPAMLVGETGLQVSTSEEGALVCLSEDGAVISVGSTDSAGDVTLTFDPIPAPTTLTLTVTAFNRVTVVHEVPVLPGTGAPEEGTPRATALRSVRPNPTRDGSRIEYSLSREGRVVVEVFSVGGRKVKTVADRREAPGVRSVFWDGRDDEDAPVASGVYLVRLAAGDYRATRKIAVVK